MHTTRSPRAAHASVPDSAALLRVTPPTLAAASASTMAAVVLFDLALTGRLSLFFDLCFVLVALVGALVAREDAWLVAAWQPPVLMGLTVAMLALVEPTAVVQTHHAFASTLLAGLAHHAAALVAGHLSALVAIGVGLRTKRRGGGWRYP